VNAPHLELDGVSVSYGQVTALHPLSLTLQPGEFFCLLGPSGCGKSTTLGAIAGFSGVSGGRVLLEGRDITATAPQRREFGIVFQNYALFPHMTAAENIGYGLKVRKTPRGEAEKRVAELLALVHLDGKGGRYPRQMSGGEQQRVAIARALAIRPRLLLLDEPLSNLDAKLREEMRNELKRIQRTTGVTTIFVTHDQEEAFGAADRIAILNHGRLEQVGTPMEIYWAPQTMFVARFIGKANFLDGSWSAETGTFTASGHSFRCVRRPDIPDGPATLLLRPEEARISQEPAERNSLPGSVTDAMLLGGVAHVRVETPVGEFLIFRLGENSQRIAMGDRMHIGWPADAGRLMPAARDG
jgi:putative spermidine/putrescine transport system ATP-binding protein